MKEWFDLQLKLYRKTQRRLNDRIKELPKDVKKYRARFRRDFHSLKAISVSDLFDRLNQSDIVLFGDFHSLRQSQKLLLRYLKEPKLKKPKSLGLEILTSAQVKNFEAYLNRPSKILEQKLKEQLQLEVRWGSSFEIYRDLFILAKKLKIPVYGLLSDEESLQKRDQQMANEISKAAFPTWVLAGEFHCASPHLPKQISKVKPKHKIFLLHQNVDLVHLQHLREMSIAKDLVFARRINRTLELGCLLHTPLWVKWQSYLDFHIEDQSELGIFDTREQMEWSLRELYSFLKDPRYPFPVPLDELLDFQTYAADDEEFSSALKRLPPKDYHRVIGQLEHSRAALVPEKRLIFLSESTLNSCAHAAGAYLYHCWTQTSVAPKNPTDLILSEFYSFFLSKILNHSRKSKASRVTEGSKLNPNELYSSLGHQLADSCFEALLSGEFAKERLLRHLTQRRVHPERKLIQMLELCSLASDF